MMKGLVVEDNADNRDLMTVLLSTEAYTIIVASDGCEGLSLALAHLPDFIITDISMPRLDGIEMIRELRMRPEFESVPIIVLTACDKPDKARAIMAGASVVMSKPVRFAELLKRIKSMTSSQPGLVEGIPEALKQTF